MKKDSLLLAIICILALTAVAMRVHKNKQKNTSYKEIILRIEAKPCPPPCKKPPVQHEDEVAEGPFKHKYPSDKEVDAVTEPNATVYQKTGGKVEKIGELIGAYLKVKIMKVQGDYCLVQITQKGFRQSLYLLRSCDVVELNHK